MNTFEQTMNSHFLRRRTTLQALQPKLKHKIYEVLWGQLQQDEVLFLTYCTDLCEQEDQEEAVTLFPTGDLPGTMGEYVDAIDRGIVRLKALLQDVRCMRGRLEALRAEIVAHLEEL